MAGETVITIVGNLTQDPELRYSASGMAVVVVNVASTTKQWDKAQSQLVDKGTLFLKGKAFGEFAENIAESVRKGDRVIAKGRLEQNSYESKQGVKVTTLELNLDDFGASFRYAQATIEKNARKGAAKGANNAPANAPISEATPF